jgi:hypothetical protein
MCIIKPLIDVIPMCKPFHAWVALYKKIKHPNIMLLGTSFQSLKYNNNNNNSSDNNFIGVGLGGMSYNCQLYKKDNSKLQIY